MGIVQCCCNCCSLWLFISFPPFREPSGYITVMLGSLNSKSDEDDFMPCVFGSLWKDRCKHTHGDVFLFMYKECIGAMSSSKCCLTPSLASFLDRVKNYFMLILAKPLFTQRFEIHHVKLLTTGNGKKPLLKCLSGCNKYKWSSLKMESVPGISEGELLGAGGTSPWKTLLLRINTQNGVNAVNCPQVSVPEYCSQLPLLSD